MNIFQKYYQLYYKTKIFFPKKSYSLLSEDLFVDKYLKKRDGIYIDIGCYHPLQGNNTILLHKRGWNGINIDINKTSIDLFNHLRPDDENLHLAVSNKNKIIKLYYRKKINMLNTVDKNFAEKNFPNGFKTSKIKSLKLDDIIKKSKFNHKNIDFLNIDVEGHEINVLKSLNFNKYKPKLICVEIHHSNKKELINNNVYKFLITKKYKKVWQKEYSLIFKI